VIEKTQAQINKLKDLKTGMMQELLSPREGQAATINNPQGESKNSLHHTEFKDSPLGRIPVGWEVKYFSEVIINLNQGVNTTTEKVTYSKSGVPAIRSNNVKENRLDMSNKKFVSLDIFNQLSNKVKPNANDILYCNIGSDLGAASVVTTNENFLITWNILRITANIDIVLPKFFSYLLNSNRKELRKVATESTMPFISSKVLSKFQFIIPPVDAQIPLVKILESVDKKIYVAESKLKSLKNSKKALMQDLLTGKVRVTAPSHPCDHGISASMHVTVDAS
jgi:type I restriction enzyme S subunit